MQKINPSLAIGLVIENSQGKILLVKEARDKYYEKTKDIWGLPVGKVEWTEPIIKGLRREMKEELDITVTPTKIIGIYQYCRNNSQCLGLAFATKIDEKSKKININKNELQDTRWLSNDEILKSNTKLRLGTKEVIKDYMNGLFLPITNIHLFNLKEV